MPPAKLEPLAYLQPDEFETYIVSGSCVDCPPRVRHGSRSITAFESHQTH